jgi:trehalose synthase
MQTVDIAPVPADRFEAFMAAEPMRRFLTVLEAGADRFADRTLWHVNSTSQGGGVAEMLQSLLGYLVGAGIPTRGATLGHRCWSWNRPRSQSQR